MSKTISVTLPDFKTLRVRPGDILIIRVPEEYDTESTYTEIAELSNTVGIPMVCFPDNIKISAIRKQLEQEESK